MAAQGTAGAQQGHSGLEGLWNTPARSPGQSSSIASTVTCLVTESLRKKKQEESRVGESLLKVSTGATLEAFQAWVENFQTQSSIVKREFIKNKEQR